MAIALQSVSSLTFSAAATTTTLDWTAGGSTPSNQLLVAQFAFEGVAAGSGPYITSVVQSGWSYLCTQAPSGTGNGSEVWFANNWTSGPTTQFNFGSTYAFVARGSIWTGQLVLLGTAIRAFTSGQYTGNAIQSPSIFAYANECVVSDVASQLTAPGFGAPTSPAGFTLAIDNARGGAFGNVELGSAYRLQAADGNTGAIGYTATAAGAGTLGTGITFVIRAPQTPAHQFHAYLV